MPARGHGDAGEDDHRAGELGPDRKGGAGMGLGERHFAHAERDAGAHGEHVRMARRRLQRGVEPDGGGREVAARLGGARFVQDGAGAFRLGGGDSDGDDGCR
jgi:hypothetical protein